MYFCVKCGKEIENGIFCSEHDTDNEGISSEINLKACPSGKYYFYLRWKKYSSPEAFLKAVLKKKFNKTAEVNFVEENSKKMVLEADGQLFELKIEKSDAIAKQHSQYFEGIIQFRYNKDLEPRVNKALKQQMKLWANKEIYVTKESKQEKGIDWWVTSKKAISLFADRLNKSYGAKISKNPKLFTRNRQTSKEVYRLNVLVQFPNFVEGNAIKINNKIAKVVQLRRFIKALDLKTGKTFGFTLNDEPEVLKIKKTRISSVLPQIKILDPESFQEVGLANEKLLKEPLAGQKIKVVLVDNKYYYLS